MGTPEFSVPVLEALVEAGHEVVCVYCQPPRPAGRGKQLRPTPVHARAEALGLPVRHPRSFKDSNAVADFVNLIAEAAVVVAYGLILPQALLDAPAYGCINIHASLLPRWRGAAPIQRAILASDDETGICIMQMEAGLDTGPVIARAHCPIHDNDTAQQLHDRLAQLGAETLLNALPDLTSLQQHAEVQDHQLSTYASKLQKAEANINWQNTAKAISRQIHAFNPWPIAQTQWQQKTFRIWSAEDINTTHAASPGQVLHADKNGIDIACGQGVLRVTDVQLPGKRAMSASDFLNANTLPIGEQLG